LNDIKSYMDRVIKGELPINHQVIYQLQDIFNLLPQVNTPDFVAATFVKTNDQALVVYLASMIRSVIALHNLINNKIQNKETVY
jgi:26S proteasome regulatory subunit N8